MSLRNRCRMLTVALTAALMAVMGSRVPCAAEGVDAATNSGGATVTVRSNGSSGGGGKGAQGGGGRGGSTVHCTRHSVIFNGMADGLGAWLGTAPSTKGLGALDWVSCTDSATGRTTGRLDLGTAPGPTPAPVPAPQVLAAEAAAALNLDLPDIATAPPRGGLQLAGVDVWFWATGKDAHTATASIQGLSATVTARATKLDLRFDDGATQSCPGLGAPYAEDRPADTDTDTAAATCRHVFTTRARHAVTATVTWELRWEATDGSGGALDPVARTTTFALDVSDGQAVTD